MAKIVTTFLAAIIIVIAAFSQETWKRHESADGGYSVLIPAGMPTGGTRRVGDDSGTEVTLNSLAVNSGVTRYVVTYYDVDEWMSFSLSRARDGIVRKLNGKLVTERSARVSGIPSRTFRVHANSNRHEITLNARIFWTRKRVYLLQVIFPRSLENTTAEDSVRRFFNSFAIAKDVLLFQKQN